MASADDVGMLGSANGQELLENLIKEGLTPSGQDTDPSRYRKLVQVLFENCILKPISRDVPRNQQQTQYTLTILQRQTNLHPGLLHDLLEDAPFYQWLLPKLIHAAVNAKDEQLYNEILTSTTIVLHAVGRDVHDDESVWAKGPRRLNAVLSHLAGACKDIISNRRPIVFRENELPPNAPTLIFILTVLVGTRAPHTDAILSESYSMLSQATRFAYTPILQIRYVRAVSDVVDRLQCIALISACKFVSDLPTLKDREWTDALLSFFNAVCYGDESVRYELWWSLYRQAKHLDVTGQIDFAKACYLLTPITPRLDLGTILTYVDQDLRKKWKAQVSQDSDKSAMLQRLLMQQGAFITKKRKRSEEGIAAATIVKEIYPNFEPTGEDLLPALLALEDPQPLGSALSKVVCAVANCKLHHCQPFPRSLPEEYLDIWVKCSRAELPSMRSLCRIIDHTPPLATATGLQLSHRQAIFEIVIQGLHSMERSTRLMAGRAFSLLFACQSEHPDRKVAERNRQRYISKLGPLLASSTVTRETAVQLLGDLGRQAEGESLCCILQHLISQLGSGSSPVRSLAYTELLALSKHHGKTPYTLLSPFLKPISILLADNLVRSPDMVGETMDFINMTRQNFLETTLPHTLPALVLAQNSQALGLVASVVKQRLGVLIMDQIAPILARVFLDVSRTDASLHFLVTKIQSMTSANVKAPPVISATSLMTACIVDLLVMLIVELGDDDKLKRDAARKALEKAQSRQGNKEDLGAYLKPHMLGVISQLNDMLHDILGKKTVDSKRKIIRSLGRLIRLVGDSMASFSPQIMASLQSTLGIKELREETLKTWSLFITTLRFADVGPFVGRTTGALVAGWHAFDAKERGIAAQIINDIAGNAKHLSQFVDEIVGMDDIPELTAAAAILTSQRRRTNIRDYIIKILDRADSKNVAIATASLRELRLLLLSRQPAIEALVRGDSFDPTMARVMSSLLSATTRDGDNQALRDVGYECMGIVGALDPDRLGLRADAGTMTLEHNFTEQEESINFALHLIRDLLVDAFRATNDTKHQTHLAYAIQELLKYCGFTPKVVLSTDKNSRIKAKWQSLPKDQLETLTPLLESRFSISDSAVKTYSHPIYTEAPTYREWLQRWTTDLIGKVMSMSGDDRGIRDSKTIFGAFRGVLRNQDVTVAHHILPHLVLNVLLSGMPTYRDEICLEINVVLQDQVNPTGSLDKRTLSAQVIFDLMDHLSKWLMLFRANRTDRGSHTKIIESVLSGVETELMANAALQSKAYARSLRSFEQRVVQLRHDNRDNSDLQAYFERLHQIYAELDEPDGMEGVSAFVISPSLEHQIREHESTGRWTSAQSCWEVRLQQSPDDVNLHVGLLKCLRNLGHYDTLRTHIRGVLSRHSDWSTELASFEAEAAWIIGDWDTVRQIGNNGPPVGQALLALHEHRNLESVLLSTRRDLGSGITSKQYGSVYEPLLQLHLLREIEMIHGTKRTIEATPIGPNRNALVRNATQGLTSSLDSRFAFTSPAFRVREAILSIRRTAYGLINTPLLNDTIGDTWILSSKIARKAGYEQTAYSAVLQAKEADAPFAFIQQAKLLRSHGGVYKALTDVDNALKPLLKDRGMDVIDLAGGEGSEVRDFDQDRKLAKAVLLVARWSNETDRFERNQIIERYQEAINRSPNVESPYYHLGHYYDSMSGTPEQMAIFHYHTCHYYCLALRHGVKYIYQTMPRMLTLWLDLGEVKDEAGNARLNRITQVLNKARRDLPAYQFLTAFPQIVSRIVHPNEAVASVLKKIMATVISRYPQQALWPAVGAMQSKRPERRKVANEVTTRASSHDPTVALLIRDAINMSSVLLQFTDDKVDDKKRTMSIDSNFAYVNSALPTRMILPLQDALTCVLPTTADTVLSHNPFPTKPIEIAGFDDRVDVMPSLQKPKKLVFIGSDGKKYPFLCKPHDDLRKDARLMDLNSMINKLLKSATESRRRQLYIRTYAVMPLNEECGLLEWVANTYALKGILEKGYARYSKKIYTNDIHALTENARKQGGKDNLEPLVQVFKKHILPKYTPTVFHEWFLTTWPEPSAWLASRMAYGRTLAVMSMIGYVLGLGDRHGENILFDGLSGDTVHVDLNCLFDKGKTFEIPERVPFRLTQNMVDALGVTGVEGVFRKAAEITMDILRSNSDSLMSVLEAFVHDPLIEWMRSGRSKSDRDVKASADKNMKPIKAKLRGIMEEGTVVSVPSQVEVLIKQATSPANLAAMYVGWASWL
ncbi:serine/threonine-protein kinase ATR [Kwoniella heveanensis CBS 569]|nr:serine/threonine-protein kinase ATR [Kwoniella heveanensis CBS 569]